MAQNKGIPTDADKILFAEDCMNYMMYKFYRVSFIGHYGQYRSQVYNAFNESVKIAFRFLHRKLNMLRLKFSLEIPKVDIICDNFVTVAKDLAGSYFSGGFDAEIFLHYCVFITSFAMFFHKNKEINAPKYAVLYIYKIIKEHDMATGGWFTLNKIAGQYATLDQNLGNIESPKIASQSTSGNQDNVHNCKVSAIDDITRFAKRYFGTICGFPERYVPIAQNSMTTQLSESLAPKEVLKNPSQNEAASSGIACNANAEWYEEKESDHYLMERLDNFNKRFKDSEPNSISIETLIGLISGKDFKFYFGQDFVYNSAENAENNQNIVDHSKGHLMDSLTEVGENYFATNEQVKNLLELSKNLTCVQVPDNLSAQNSMKIQGNVDSGKDKLNNALTGVMQSSLAANDNVANPLKRSLPEAEITEGNVEKNKKSTFH